MTEPWLTPADLDKFFGDVQPSIVHLPDPQAAIAGMKKLIRKITGDFAGRRFLDISCRQGYAVMAAKELGFQAKGIDPHDLQSRLQKEHDVWIAGTLGPMRGQGIRIGCLGTQATRDHLEAMLTALAGYSRTAGVKDTEVAVDRAVQIAAKVT